MSFYRPSIRMWIALSFLIVVLDQALKYHFNTTYLLYQRVPVWPFFSWTLAYNTGAAFSFLSDSSGWQRWFFIFVGMLVSIILCFWLAKLKKKQWLTGLAIALILGGAVGNLYDRIALGYVVDFILLHYKHYYFPAFNLADTSITLGVVFMILDEIKHGYKCRCPKVSKR